MSSDMKNNDKKIVENDFDEIEDEVEEEVEPVNNYKEADKVGLFSQQKSGYKILAEDDSDESNFTSKTAKQVNKKKLLIISIAATAILLMTLLGFFISINSILGYKKIYTGISAGGIDLSGKTTEQAKTLLIDTYVTKFKECTMTLKWIEGNEKYPMSDFTETPDIDRIVDDAYKIGRSEGGAFKRYKVISQLKQNPKKIEMSTVINKEKISVVAQKMTDTLYVEAINPIYNIMPLTLTLTSGHRGVDVNKDKLVEDMTAAIKNLKTGDIMVATSVVKISELSFDQIYALINIEPVDATIVLRDAKTLEITQSVEGKGVDEAVLRQAVSEINNESIGFKSIDIVVKLPALDKKIIDGKMFRDILSENSLVLPGADSNRSSNIKIVIDILNDLIIMPGQEFDFNSLVGELTEIKGYKDAIIYPEIQDKKVLGGGVSDVASVLFISALSSSLDVTERHNSEYVINKDLLGLDADIKYGTKNLKFKNNTAYPIKFNLRYSNSQMICKIYGTNEYSGRVVQIKTKKINQTDYEVVYKFDSDIPKGTESISIEGIVGYEYETMILIDNKEKSNSKFTSIYLKRDQVILTSEENT